MMETHFQDLERLLLPAQPVAEPEPDTGVGAEHDVEQHVAGHRLDVAETETEGGEV
jgi:hypothetical protein